MICNFTLFTDKTAIQEITSIPGCTMSRHDNQVSEIPFAVNASHFSWKEMDNGSLKALLCQVSEKSYLCALLMTVDYEGERHFFLVFRKGSAVNDFSLSELSAESNNQKKMSGALSRLLEIGFQRCAKHLNTQMEIDGQVLQSFQRYRKENLDFLRDELRSYCKAIQEKFPVNLKQSQMTQFVGGASSIWSEREIMEDMIFLDVNEGSNFPRLLVFYQRFLIVVCDVYQGDRDILTVNIASHRCNLSVYTSPDFKPEEETEVFQFCETTLKRAESLAEQKEFLTRWSADLDKKVEYYALVRSTLFLETIRKQIMWRYQGLIDKHKKCLAIKAQSDVHAAAMLIQKGRMALSALDELITNYTNKQLQSSCEANEVMRGLTARIKKCEEFFEGLEKKLLDEGREKERSALKKQFDSLNQREDDLRRRCLQAIAKDYDSRKSNVSSRQPKQAAATACAATVTQQVVSKKVAVLEKMAMEVIVEPVVENNIEPKTMISAMSRAPSSERTLQSRESKKQAQLQAKIRELEANVASLNAVVRREKAVTEVAMKKQADAEAKAKADMAAAAACSAKALEKKDAEITALREAVEKVKETLAQGQAAQKMTQEQCDALTIELRKVKLSAENEAKQYVEKEKGAEVERQRLSAEMANLRIALQRARDHHNEILADAEAKAQAEIARVVAYFQDVLKQKDGEICFFQEQVQKTNEYSCIVMEENRIIQEQLQAINAAYSFHAAVAPAPTNQMMPSSAGASFFGGTTPPATMNQNECRSIKPKLSSLAIAFLGPWSDS
jgi:hypothetical protein